MPSCKDGRLPSTRPQLRARTESNRIDRGLGNHAATLASDSFAPRTGIEPVSDRRQRSCDPIASRGVGRRVFGNTRGLSARPKVVQSSNRGQIQHLLFSGTVLAGVIRHRSKGFPDDDWGDVRGTIPLETRVHSAPGLPTPSRHSRVGENRTRIHRVPKTRVHPIDFNSVGHVGIEPTLSALQAAAITRTANDPNALRSG